MDNIPKQGKIREGIDDLLKDMLRCFKRGEWVDTATVTRIIQEFENSQGVVLKVERELPKDELAEMVLRQSEVLGMEGAQHPYYKAQLDMVRAGYVAVESLIEGQKNEP